MPINSANSSDNSQLLKEISKLNLSGSGTGFRYIKHANCNLVADTETEILQKTQIPSLREVFLVSNTLLANIEIFWDDGVNKVKIPDKLEGISNYINYDDGGLTLSVLSNTDANIDVYVRDKNLINYQVGNVVEVPVNEDIWYVLQSNTLEIFRIPLKPVFINISDSQWLNYPLIAIPISSEIGYDYANKKQLGIVTGAPLIWENLELQKYQFYISLDEEYGESYDLYVDDALGIVQNSEKWLINLV